MNTYFLILLSFFIISCAEQTEPIILEPETPKITNDNTDLNNEDYTLEFYVKEFEDYYNLNVNHPVVFGSQYTSYNPIGSSIIGVCVIFDNLTRKVEINKSWWESSSSNIYSKKMLVFHELGHCTLNRLEHDCSSQNYPEKDCDENSNPATIVSGGNPPKSIMYPIINPIASWYYFWDLNNLNRKDEFLDELIINSDQSSHYSTINSLNSDHGHNCIIHENKENTSETSSPF